MKTDQIKSVLSQIRQCPSRWELDTIIWADRLSNPNTLTDFFERINFLENKTDKTLAESQELEILLDLLEDMDEDDLADFVDQTDDEAREQFIENLARTSSIEVLTAGKLSFETMTTACKLSPNDFILCAKRTQDLINAVQGLVIKGETLSKDVAGA